MPLPPTPAPLNFKQAKDRLADWVSSSTSSPRWTDATRGIIVNRAIRYLARKYDLAYNESQLDISAVATYRDYDLTNLAPDFSRPYFCSFLGTDSVTRFVYFMPKDKFDTAFPDASKTGDPTNFTIWRGTITFGKTPARNMTISLLYYATPVDLSSDTDFNDYLAYAWDVVFDRALVEATEYLIDDERIDVWKAKWKDTESVLVMEQARRRSMGLIPQSVEPH